MMMIIITTINISHKTCNAATTTRRNQTASRSARPIVTRRKRTIADGTSSVQGRIRITRKTRRWRSRPYCPCRAATEHNGMALRTWCHSLSCIHCAFSCARRWYIIIIICVCVRPYIAQISEWISRTVL